MLPVGICAMHSKRRLQSILRDSFRVGGWGGGGGSQKCISKFENPVIRPVFHR